MHSRSPSLASTAVVLFSPWLFPLSSLPSVKIISDRILTGQGSLKGGVAFLLSFRTLGCFWKTTDYIVAREGGEKRELFDQEPASYGPRIPSCPFSLSLRLRPPRYVWVPLFIGPSLMYSHGLDYRFNIPPFPLSAPLDVLPFTTTSFSPLSSSPSCCFPVYLPIDP